RLLILTLFLGLASFTLAGTAVEPQPGPTPEEQNSRDIFNAEGTYTFRSDYKDDRFGGTSSLYEDFSYDHRFLIRGNWFFRAGFEYERFDFDQSENGLPDHLQTFHGNLAI